MSNKDFPEKDPEERNTPEGAVDFSDLGPLFSPAAPAEKPEAPENTEILTEPDVPENADILAEPDDAYEELPGEDTPSEEEPLPEEAGTPPEEEDSPVQDPPAVDFSDLGPLFQQDLEEIPVVAGEAALLLKKLSEMPAEEPEPPAAQEDLPEEVPVPELPEEEAASEEDADISAEESQEAEIPEEIPAEEPEISLKPQPEEEPEAVLREVPEAEPPENAEVPASQETEVPEKAPEAEKPAYHRYTRKGRPKRKKGEGFFGIPNLLVTAVWIAITVLIGVTLGRMAWVCAADVLAFGREDKPVTITVYEADTIEDITRKLHEGGLIRYPGLFKFYASLAVDEGEIHPGIWDLNTRYDYHALVNMMSPSSSREVIELMIPEGYSCRQIFALMEENKICTSLDLGAYAASGELDDYWFLEGVPRGDMYCLEGYLFPDTYQFYKNDSPRSVLTKMLNNFESRFDEAMVAQIDSLNAHLAELMKKGGHNAAFIEENRFTVQDVINVASLIEKETSSADEGYVIASVIYNRLFNWPGNVPYLNIDATIVYALGGKNNLTQEDLKVNSPYNTYTHTGLTPGPIANPGLSSIRAALDPSESNYYYYVLDPALGSHRFSTTYDEHKANIASIGD